MATTFPETDAFQGLNAPVRMEVDIRNLPVEGEIPAEINGAFFRAVPDPAFAPMLGDDIVLSGDGMVAKFTIENGHVDYAIKYVETERLKAERKARRGLFGHYRNPFTDDPSVEGINRTVANTTPVWHAGQLFMTKEDGRAYEVDPDTLETIGSWDYHGALKSETMTAHVRVDPETGEMFFYGYEAGGLCSTDIAYAIADRHGNLVSEQWFKAPYCAMIHDFAITEKYAIFPLFPTTADLDRLKQGGAHWVHEQDRESLVAIIPRYGKVEDARWFKGPPGVSAYHLMNAFDDGDLVHLDICISDTNAFPFIREASGIHRMPWEVHGELTRWTFDMSKPEDRIETRTLGPAGDMPRIADADQGRQHRVGWYLTVDPTLGPPIKAGPVGAAFNTMLRIEPGNGRIESYSLKPGMGINEPVHVPSSQPGHEGWLLAVVDEAAGDDFRSALWVFEAGDIGKGPIASVPVPVRCRPQVHGWWVSADQLAGAKRRAAA